MRRLRLTDTFHFFSDFAINEMINPNKDNDIDVITDLKCDNLCRHGRTDVCTKDD